MFDDTETTSLLATPPKSLPLRLLQKQLSSNSMEPSEISPVSKAKWRPIMCHFFSTREWSY